MVIDPVSDVLLRIRNASAVKNKYVFLQKSRLTIAILKILVSEGFIQTYTTDSLYVNEKELCVFLKYRGCALFYKVSLYLHFIMKLYINRLF